MYNDQKSTVLYLGYSDLNADGQKGIANGTLKVSDVDDKHFNSLSSFELKKADVCIFIHTNERKLIKSKY